MTLATEKTAIIAAATHSNAVFNGAVLELFNTFQHFVSGTTTGYDMSVPCDTLRAEMLSLDPQMPERLVNTWDQYARTLTGAYERFAQDIPHRMGHDEQAHVRTFALHVARDAFTGSRDTAWQVYRSKVEGTTLEPRPTRDDFKTAFVATEKAA